MADFVPSRMRAVFEPSMERSVETGAVRRKSVLSPEEAQTRTIETPDGPVTLTATGEEVLSQEELGRRADAADALRTQRSKIKALENLATFAAGGGPLADELAGLNTALDPEAIGRRAMASGSVGEFLEKSRADYAARRDQARKDLRLAEERGPQWSLPVVGEVNPYALAGAMAPGAALGPAGVAATLGQRALAAGILGAEYGGAASEAETPLGVAADTAVGGAAGLAGGALAEIPGMVARKGSAMVRKYLPIMRDRAKEIGFAPGRSATSEAGTPTSVAFSANEKYLLGILEAPEKYEEATVRAAQEMMASRPDLQQRYNEFLRRQIEDIPNKIGASEALRDRAAMLVKESPQRAEEAFVEMQTHPFKSLGPMAERFALRQGLAAAGTALGGPLGGAAASAPGGVQALKNLSERPQVWYGVGRKLEQTFGPVSRTAEYAPVWSQAATRDQEGDKDANAIQAFLGQD